MAKTSLPFAFPAEIAGMSVAVRLQSEADLPFVEKVYISHRWDELSAVPWPDAQKRAFLQSQFHGQWQHYSTAYSESYFLIVEVDGGAAGRLYLYDDHPYDVRIVEISLMPAFRGHGLGGGLLTAVQKYAARRGKKCSIHVEQSNPARRLYRRLGFVEVKPVGPYYLLEWKSETREPVA